MDFGFLAAPCWREVFLSCGVTVVVPPVAAPLVGEAVMSSDFLDTVPVFIMLILSFLWLVLR